MQDRQARNDESPLSLSDRAARDTRKPYTSPVLEDLGELAQVTMGGIGGASDFPAAGTKSV